MVELDNEVKSIESQSQSQKEREPERKRARKKQSQKEIEPESQGLFAKAARMASWADWKGHIALAMIQ